MSETMQTSPAPTTAAPTPVPPPPVKRPWWRSYRVPLVMFLLPVFLIVLVRVWIAQELDPRAVMPLIMAFMFSLQLAVLVTAVWFFFLSYFRWRTRLIVLLLVVSLPWTSKVLIRKIEFSGNMGPMVVWAWEPDPELARERHREVQKNAAGELPSIDLAVGPEDFAEYRGAKRDGIVPGTWAKLKVGPAVWRQPGGGGYAGFALAGNVAVTIEQVGNKEEIVCYDQDTGRQRWAYSYEAKFKQSEPMGGDGPRATPTIADGDVFSLGAMGDLVCLDGRTGELRWRVNILEDCEAKNMEWGMTSSPLVLGDLVVVNAGINPEKGKNAMKAVAAYKRKDGKRAWAKGEHPAGYSSAQRAKLDGVEQILLFDGGGLTGLNPATGDELWRYQWETFNNMNIIQPLVIDGNRVFISSEMANGCALVEVKISNNNWTVKPVWEHRKMSCKFSNPVYHKGHIYGLSANLLTCIKADTGERCWRDGRYYNGQLLLLGDTLLILTEDRGEVVTVAADPEAFHELSKTEVFGGKTWNTPAVARGRLFIRNHKEMACLSLR